MYLGHRSNHYSLSKRSGKDIEMAYSPQMDKCEMEIGGDEHRSGQHKLCNFLFFAQQVCLRIDYFRTSVAASVLRDLRGFSVLRRSDEKKETPRL